MGGPNAAEGLFRSGQMTASVLPPPPWPPRFPAHSASVPRWAEELLPSWKALWGQGWGELGPCCSLRWENPKPPECQGQMF